MILKTLFIGPDVNFRFHQVVEQNVAKVSFRLLSALIEEGDVREPAKCSLPV